MPRPRLTYANVMATVAVFLALGGGAIAATSLPANSVGAKQLKAGAVTAAKIKNGTITGVKLNTATLGTVPSAESANRATTANTAERATRATEADHAASASNADEAAHAADADALGGIPAGSYLTSSQVGYIDRTYNGCTIAVTCAEDVLTIGGVTFRAVCETAAGVAGIVIQVSGATRTGYGFATGSTEARRGGFEGAGNIVAASTPSSEAKGATGTIVARNNSRVVSLNFDATAHAATPSIAVCTLQATALAA